MTETGAIPDKWGGEALNPTVEFFHSAVRKLVAERFAASGKTWEESVVDRSVDPNPPGATAPTLRVAG